MTMIQKLRQNSCPADMSCVIDRRSLANISLRCQDASLVRLKMADGSYEYVWSHLPNGAREMAYQYAFYKTSVPNNPDIKEIYYLHEDEIFCDGGYAYYLQKSGGDLVIRHITVYSTQDILSEILKYYFQKGLIQNIMLVSVSHLMDKSLQNIVCWFIDGEEADMYLAVFADDRSLLQGFNPSMFRIRELHAGALFVKNTKLYRVEEYDGGKLAIVPAENVFQHYNYREKAENHEEEQKKEPKFARIIPLRQR